MKRMIGTFVAGCVGALVTMGGCVDLRNLNPCRAVAHAYCERAIACGMTHATVDDCALTLVRSYYDRVGPYADNVNACPSSPGACIDKIEGAVCGRAIDAPECGEVLANRVSLPGPGTANPIGDAGSSGSSRDGASSGTAATQTAPLLPTLPNVLEIVDGTLVACAEGHGCRSNEGDYGKVTFVGTAAFDSQARAYGLTPVGPALVWPDGRSESLSTSTPLFSSVFTLRPGRLPVFVGGSPGALELLRPTGSSLAPVAYVSGVGTITGVASLHDELVVSTDEGLFECRGGECKRTSPVRGTVYGTDSEGTFLFVTEEGTTHRFTNGEHTSTYPFAACLWATEVRETIVCVTTTRQLYVGERLLPDARDVHLAATNGEVLYWVTTSDTYWRIPL